MIETVSRSDVSLCRHQRMVDKLTWLVVHTICSIDHFNVCRLHWHSRDLCTLLQLHQQHPHQPGTTFVRPAFIRHARHGNLNPNLLADPFTLTHSLNSLIFPIDGCKRMHSCNKHGRSSSAR